jgi:thiol-disulfide isomerase/thioredoxin
LASIAWLWAAPALAAASDLVPIAAVDKAELAVPGIETKGAKLTALHLWAIWCVPCLKELPEVDATAAAYKDKGLRVTAISLDTDMNKVKTFFAEKGIKTLIPAIDANNAVFRAAALRGLPGTLFFNEKGEVVGRADGPLDWKAKTTADFIESHLK